MLRPCAVEMKAKNERGKLTGVFNKAEEQELAQVSRKTSIEHNVAL